MRKTLILNEQDDTNLGVVSSFNDSEEYTIDDLVPAFVMFSKKFGSFEEAIDHLSQFVKESYSGNDANKFKDTLRSGYRDLVDGMLEDVRGNLEKRIVKCV